MLSWAHIFDMVQGSISVLSFFIKLKKHFQCFAFFFLFVCYLRRKCWASELIKSQFLDPIPAFFLQDPSR